MGFQKTTVTRTKMMNEVLDLEKKYFAKINEMVQSEKFLNDLLLIEKEIRENYHEFKNTWNLKNKIKVPAERLIRHYIYMEWHEDIESIYPSPVSSDLGIKMKDAIVCVDIKTIDTVGNSGDISSTSTEKNQNSFDNKNYPVFEFKSNLKSIDHYSRRPVLTFIIKIIYSDDNYSFKLCRKEYPAIITTCIPNGEISGLFDFNIIDNFKTYDYYEEQDGSYWKPYIIRTSSKKSSEIKIETDIEFIKNRAFVDMSDRIDKVAYYDVIHHCIWWLTSHKNKKAIKAVKSGSSVRYNNEILKKRFDSKDEPWIGYIEYRNLKDL